MVDRAAAMDLYLRLKDARERAMMEAQRKANVVMFTGYKADGQEWSGELPTLPKKRPVVIEGAYIGADDQRRIANAPVVSTFRLVYE